MKHYVENKGLGKVLRTLGFFLLLSAVLLTSLEMLYGDAFEFFASDTLRNLLLPVNDVIAQLSFLDGTQFAFVFFGLGLTLLVITLKKSTFAKVIASLLVLFLTLILLYAENQIILPISEASFSNQNWLDNLLALGSVAFDPILALNEFAVPLASLLLVLIGWQTFATKKPKRISTSFVRFGFAFLFLAVLLYFAQIAFEDGFVSSNIYQTIQNYSYFIALDLMTIGSLFGILGFFRK